LDLLLSIDCSSPAAMSGKASAAFNIQLNSDGSYEVRRVGEVKGQKRSATDSSKKMLKDLQGEKVEMLGDDDSDSDSGVFARFVSAPYGPIAWLMRMWGKGGRAPKFVGPSFILWAVGGSFLGIFLLQLVNVWLLGENERIFVVGSFGAQAVLIFAAPGAPLAQPWNALCGQVIGAFWGVLCWKAVGSDDSLGAPALASGLAVSLAIGSMLLTGSLHPPGGATALIATIGSDAVKHLGFKYILWPALFGTMFHLFIAIMWDNLSASPARQYPAYWKFWSPCTPANWPYLPCLRASDSSSDSD